MTEWQRITWTFLHTITLNYNDQYKQEYLNFFDTLKTIIPCKICRNHYIQNITNNNVKCDKIFNWTVDLHNSVNKQRGKHRFTESESIAFYSRLGSLGRSPVITTEDFAEADMRAILRGFGLGVAITAICGATVWYVSKGDS
jgi:hypothetical protein